MSLARLKQRGMSLMELMVVLGVMAIVVTGLAGVAKTFMEQLNLVEMKRDSLNFAEDLDTVLYSDVCNCQLDPTTSADDINDAELLLSPAITDGSQVIELERLRSGCGAADPIIVEKGMMLPSRLKVESIKILNLRPTGVTNEWSGDFTLDWQERQGSPPLKPLINRMKFQMEPFGMNLRIDVCKIMRKGKMSNTTLSIAEIEKNPAFYDRKWDIDLNVGGGNFENKWRFYIPFDDSPKTRFYTFHVTPHYDFSQNGMMATSRTFYKIRPFFPPYGVDSSCAMGPTDRLSDLSTYAGQSWAILPTVTCTGMIPPNQPAANRKLGFIQSVVHQSPGVERNRPSIEWLLHPELERPSISLTIWEAD